MTETINKILAYLQENNKVNNLLFYVSGMVSKNTDTSIWIRNEYKKDLKNVEWIYTSKVQDFNLIGIEKYKWQVLCRCNRYSR